MAKNKTKVKIKPSTNELIDNAIAQQNSWMENRRAFARRFLKRLNIFARPNPTPAPKKEEPAPVKRKTSDSKIRNILRAYWFPIFCALAVIFVAVWVASFHKTTHDVTIVPDVPEPVVRNVHTDADKKDTDTDTGPSFDIVRIEPDGNVIVAGRWMPSKNISVVINGKIVETQRTDAYGEFVYAPSNPLAPGNYTISLLGADPDMRSVDKVFLYVSEHGYKNSVSLLMTRDGSTLLQSPSMLMDGDLVVSKIDYLSTGRIVVTGDAMPRLRVSLTLNDKYMGFARVSDYRHFGLGADVGELTPGKEYNLTVRLHDGDGNTVATVNHNFVMPEMTGDEDTFYTVRRGDCLWIIARNFLRRGILFSMIAERNNIKNPDLIYPKQVLQIPVKE